MKGLCKKCSRRDLCVNLCATAADYVNQDVSRSINEFLISNVENFSEPPDYDTVKSDFQIIYELFFLDNISPSDISFHIYTSERRIYEIIKDLKDGVNDIDSEPEYSILKLHFIDRKGIVEISEELRVWDLRVSRIINEYLKSKRKRKYVRKSKK